MMNKFREIFALLAATAALTLGATAQTFPSAHYIDQIFHPPRAATQVPGSQGIEDLIAGGKLSLNLEQTVRLMLLNNTELRINQLQFQQSRFAIQKAYS